MKKKEEIILNSVPIRNPKKIKGIYFLIYRKEIVYIGSGSDIIKRLEAHKNKRKFIFDSYYIERISLRRLEISSIEAKYIEHYRPMYNKTSNPDFHNGSNDLWFRYLGIEMNVAEISRELNIPFQKVNNIIKGKRKLKDSAYEAVTKLVYKEKEVL